MRVLLPLSVSLLAIAACAGPEPGPEASSAPPADAAEQVAREQPGLHNVLVFDEGVISGSMPHGEAGFDSLRAMGVKTVISVDGGRPDVEPARARGMDYVHIPIQYSGIEEDDRLALARALREVEGPVYVHCHHGKHRGPAAAAYALAACDRISPEEGVGLLREAGTSPKYPGLYGVVTTAEPVDDAEIRRAVMEGRAELVSEARVEDFVAAMAAIGAAKENLEEVEAAGWRTPSDHPDLVPAAEAGRLSDLFRGIVEADGFEDGNEDFIGWMRDGWRAAQDLEAAIVAEDMAGADEAMGRLGASCSDCHAVYRNE